MGKMAQSCLKQIKVQPAGKPFSGKHAPIHTRENSREIVAIKRAGALKCFLLKIWHEQSIFTITRFLPEINFTSIHEALNLFKFKVIDHTHTHLLLDSLEPFLTHSRIEQSRKACDTDNDRVSNSKLIGVLHNLICERLIDIETDSTIVANDIEIELENYNISKKRLEKIKNLISRIVNELNRNSEITIEDRKTLAKQLILKHIVSDKEVKRLTKSVPKMYKMSFNHRKTLWVTISTQLLIWGVIYVKCSQSTDCVDLYYFLFSVILPVLMLFVYRKFFYVIGHILFEPYRYDLQRTGFSYPDDEGFFHVRYISRATKKDTVLTSKTWQTLATIIFRTRMLRNRPDYFRTRSIISIFMPVISSYILIFTNAIFVSLYKSPPLTFYLKLLFVCFSVSWLAYAFFSFHNAKNELSGFFRKEPTEDFFLFKNLDALHPRDALNVTSSSNRSDINITDTIFASYKAYLNYAVAVLFIALIGLIGVIFSP